MKRSQPKRDWRAARAKCDAEGCRICGQPAEAAHVIGREHDKHRPVFIEEAFAWPEYMVCEDRIVPLCSGHHRQYDRGDLDLMPYLRLPEAIQAVADAGTIPLADRRISGNRLTTQEEKP